MEIVFLALLAAVAIFILKMAIGKGKGCIGFFRWLLGIQNYNRESGKKFNPTVTVVIPAYNEEKHIGQTIESIKNQTYPVDRILVVDDCSTDGTSKIARKAGVDVIRTPKNSGTKAQAQNHAIQFIATEVIVTIDGDTVLSPDAIEKVLPALRDKEVASVCGLVVPQNIKTVWEKARFIEYLYGISIPKGAQDLWGAVLVSSGCFSAFKTDLLRESEGFPDRTMAEDMDLTWRFLKEGKVIRVVPTAVCFPLDPHNYETYRKQVERWLRSFLQNISAHGFSLKKNKGLLFFVGWYLIEGLFLAPSLVLLIYLLYMYWEFSFTPLIFTIILLEIGIVSAVAIWRGRQIGKGWLALKSIPYYYFIRPVNLYLFLKSVWLEWVKRKRLREWEKGHV